MKKILLVCTANLCRSPMAEAVLRKMAANEGLSHKLQFASAGTHAPSPPQKVDPRALHALARRGYQSLNRRSTRVQAKHLKEYDQILAMGLENLDTLVDICPAELKHKLALFMQFSITSQHSSVPDPYFSNSAAFELVLDLCESAASGLIRSYKE